MSNEAPRYWRGQEQRYVGMGSKLLELETVEGEDEQGELVKGIGLKCSLFGWDWWWIEAADDRSAFRKIGKEIREMMELGKFNQEVIISLLFEVALAWGREDIGNQEVVEELETKAA